MKFKPSTIHGFVVINDVKIDVPYGVKYVTINMNDVVQGWEVKPTIDLGYWSSETCTGIRLGIVEWDDEKDTGHYKVYEVQY